MISTDSHFRRRSDGSTKLPTKRIRIKWEDKIEKLQARKGFMRSRALSTLDAGSSDALNSVILTSKRQHIDWDKKIEASRRNAINIGYEGVSQSATTAFDGETHRDSTISSTTIIANPNATSRSTIDTAFQHTGGRTIQERRPSELEMPPKKRIKINWEKKMDALRADTRSSSTKKDSLAQGRADMSIVSQHTGGRADMSIVSQQTSGRANMSIVSEHTASELTSYLPVTGGKVSARIASAPSGAMIHPGTPARPLALFADGSENVKNSGDSAGATILPRLASTMHASEHPLASLFADESTYVNRVPLNSGDSAGATILDSTMHGSAHSLASFSTHESAHVNRAQQVPGARTRDSVTVAIAGSGISAVVHDVSLASATLDACPTISSEDAVCTTISQESAVVASASTPPKSVASAYPGNYSNSWRNLRLGNSSSSRSASERAPLARVGEETETPGTFPPVLATPGTFPAAISACHPAALLMSASHVSPQSSSASSAPFHISGTSASVYAAPAWNVAASLSSASSHSCATSTFAPSTDTDVARSKKLTLRRPSGHRQSLASVHTCSSQSKPCRCQDLLTRLNRVARNIRDRDAESLDKSPKRGDKESTPYPVHWVYSNRGRNLFPQNMRSAEV